MKRTFKIDPFYLYYILSVFILIYLLQLKKSRRATMQKFLYCCPLVGSHRQYTAVLVTLVGVESTVVHRHRMIEPVTVQ